MSVQFLGFSTCKKTGLGGRVGEWRWRWGGGYFHGVFLFTVTEQLNPVTPETFRLPTPRSHESQLRVLLRRRCEKCTYGWSFCFVEITFIREVSAQHHKSKPSLGFPARRDDIFRLAQLLAASDGAPGRGLNYELQLQPFILCLDFTAGDTFLQNNGIVG